MNTPRLTLQAVLGLGCLFVGATHQAAFAQFPTLEDEEFKTACGPIACFVALESLGIESSLAETVKRCGWVRNEHLSLNRMQDCLNSYRGVSSRVGRLSPEKLCGLLKDDQTVVIVAIRKHNEKTDHVLCAVGVDDSGQVIHVIDYPELHSNLEIGQFSEVWDGTAVVVRYTPFYRTLDKLALFSTPIVASILGLLWLGNRNAGGKSKGK